MTTESSINVVHNH